MPCESVRLTTVRFDGASIYILADALRSLGISVYGIDDEEMSIMFEGGSFLKGNFQVDERSLIARDINAVKRAYSGEVIKKTAKMYGAEVKQESPTKIRLMLRR
jgi:hypothetical protein